MEDESDEKRPRRLDGKGEAEEVNETRRNCVGDIQPAGIWSVGGTIDYLTK